MDQRGQRPCATLLPDECAHEQAAGERPQPVDPVEVPAAGHHSRSKGAGGVHAGSRHGTPANTSRTGHHSPARCVSPTRPVSHLTQKLPRSHCILGSPPKKTQAKRPVAVGSERHAPPWTCRLPPPHPARGRCRGRACRRRRERGWVRVLCTEVKRGPVVLRALCFSRGGSPHPMGCQDSETPLTPVSGMRCTHGV